MENKKQKIRKEELERKIVLVKQAVIELRENPQLMKRMEKVLIC